MTKWLLIGLGVLLFMRSRSATASTSASPDVVPEAEREASMGLATFVGARAEVERGIALAESDMDTDSERAVSVLSRWGDLLRAHPRPIPPQLAAMVIARESGGSATVGGDVVLGERGLWQLSTDECADVGVTNPTDPTASTIGAQLLYRKAIRAYPEPDVESQLLFALLSRSIGLGDARRLRTLVGSMGRSGTLAQAVRAFVEAAPGKPTVQLGREDVTTWARRVYRGCLRAEKSLTLGWVAPDSDLLA